MGWLFGVLFAWLLGSSESSRPAARTSPAPTPEPGPGPEGVVFRNTRALRALGSEQLLAYAAVVSPDHALNRAWQASLAGARAELLVRSWTDRRLDDLQDDDRRAMLAWLAIVKREGLPLSTDERALELNLVEAGQPSAAASGEVGDIRWSADPSVREAQSAQWGTTPTMAPTAPRQTMKRVIEESIAFWLTPRVGRLVGDGTTNMAWPDVEELRRRWTTVRAQAAQLPRVLERPLYLRWQLVLGAWDRYLTGWGY